MGPGEMDGYVQAATILITVAGLAVEKVREMFSAHGALTEAELDQVLTAAEAEATRRRDLAKGDAGDNPI